MSALATGASRAEKAHLHLTRNQQARDHDQTPTLVSTGEPENETTAAMGGERFPPATDPA